MHCNALQHTAMHCNTLQHTATHCNTLQHTATHCNTLQYTATRCNTLKHTATYWHTFMVPGSQPPSLDILQKEIYTRDLKNWPTKTDMYTETCKSDLFTIPGSGPPCWARTHAPHPRAHQSLWHIYIYIYINIYISHRVRECYRATCTSTHDTLPINEVELVELPLHIRR